MKRVSFILFSFLSLGLYLFVYSTDSSFQDKEIKQSYLTSISKPSWQIYAKDKGDSFELTSLAAKQEGDQEIFLLDEPIFKSYWENKLKNSASSVNAIFDLGEEKLSMINNVHLTISERDQKIDLFSEKINFDLKNKKINSKHEIYFKSASFKLNSKGFNLFQNSEGRDNLLFSKASFEQTNKPHNGFFGKADLIIYKSPSETFTMKGSAEIKLNSTSITAQEIEFNFRTNKIVSSKNSKIIKS